MTIEQHLKQRRLDTYIHKTWIDKEKDIATFALWNLSGQLIGYQRYNPEGSKKANTPADAKYYTFCNSQSALWGLESFTFSNTLFVCEGVFDAAAITSLGYSAIAVFSNNPSAPVRNWLYIVKQSRKIVTICDNDEPGKKLARYGHCSHQVSGYKDLGDSPVEYVESVIRQYKG
jgi:hypothetical protein